MNERKDIERLFQEKFKDFEATPSLQVWENISTELKKKEDKKRVVPFWFNMKAAGIAAALILGIFTANNYTNLFKFTQSKNDSETVVSTEKNQKETSKDKIETLQKSPKLNTNNSIVEDSKNKKAAINSDFEKSIILDKNNSIVSNSKNDNSVVNNNQTKITSTNHNRKSNIVSTQNNSIVVNKNEDNIFSVSKNNKNFDTKKSSNTALVSSESKEQKTRKSTYTITNKKTNQKVKLKNIGNINEIADNSESENLRNKASNKLVSNKNKSFTTNKFSEVLVQNNNKENISSSIDLNKITKEKNANSSIVNTVITNIILPEIISKDSIIIAVNEENPLEKILKEKGTKEKEEKKITQNSQKWKVKPNVAPLFMSATKGSPIDNEFADNTKSYENTLSVGLGVDYALSKNFSIRTGINKFDYSYNTNDIVYYADFASKNVNSVSNLKTINVDSDAKNMIIEDKNVSKSQEIALQTKEEGLLNQKTSYLEIPVEVSYKLLDKRFGIQVITGFSSLLLNKNEVSVISSGLTTVIGEANNLNKVHFSTNIGLGFKYSFWKSFEANFEPTFKYQLNTYNANSGGFKPYLLGLYSGVSFKF